MKLNESNYLRKLVNSLLVFIADCEPYILQHSAGFIGREKEVYLRGKRDAIAEFKKNLTESLYVHD